MGDCSHFALYITRQIGDPQLINPVTTGRLIVIDTYRADVGQKTLFLQTALKTFNYTMGNGCNENYWKTARQLE
jgi:hypothetical protein